MPGRSRSPHRDARSLKTLFEEKQKEVEVKKAELEKKKKALDEKKKEAGEAKKLHEEQLKKDEELRKRFRDRIMNEIVHSTNSFVLDTFYLLIMIISNFFKHYI